MVRLADWGVPVKHKSATREVPVRFFNTVGEGVLGIIKVLDGALADRDDRGRVVDVEALAVCHLALKGLFKEWEEAA